MERNASLSLSLSLSLSQANFISQIIIFTVYCMYMYIEIMHLS